MSKHRPLILIADDEPNICRIAKILLDPNNFEVITAENGIDAYEKIIKHQPDLIFSDILMPKCDGFELCQKVRENEQINEIPFIFLTALEEKQFKQRFDSVNANDYLIKPFNNDDLIGKINLWIKDKPVIHSEEHTINIENKNEEQPINLFGNTFIDESLNEIPLNHEYVTLIEGKINSGQTELCYDFLLEGIKNENHSIFISLKEIRETEHTFFQLSNPDKQLLHIIDASDWTSLDSQPWRSLDFIFDKLYDLATQYPIGRIAIDQFSIGYPFWEVESVLSFINRCRQLPNYQNMNLILTTNTHPSVEEFNFNIAQVVDIVISTENINSPEGIGADKEFITSS